MSVLTNNSRVEVVYIDGAKEMITVRDQLVITELYEFLNFVRADDTPSLVALCCGKDRTWINRLKVSSFRVLARKAVEANFPAAMEVVADDPIAKARLMPFIVAVARAQGLESELAVLATTSSPKTGESSSPSLSEPLPAPVSSDSAGGTGGAS